MYGLSEQPWSSTVELVHSNLQNVVQDGYNVVIRTTKPDSNTQLTTGLAVRALREMVFEMAKGCPGFYQAESFMLLNQWGIGRISIAPLEKAPKPTAIRGHPSNLPAYINAPKASATPANTSLAANSGTIQDPEDTRFVISYQYEGSNVAERGLFTAVLDGLGEIAQYNSDGPCDFISGISYDTNVVLHIGHAAGEVLFGWHAYRTLYLLVQKLFLVRHVFREMRFSLLFYGKVVGNGYIMKIGSPDLIGISWL